MKKVVVALAAAGLVLASAVAYAQMHQMPNSGQMQGPMSPGMMHGPMMPHGMMRGDTTQPHGPYAAEQSGDTSPSSLAFRGINAKMHSAMNIALTGNADADFVRGMIPHHEGAIDMAKTVLAFGTDPEVRKLAEEIIRAQQSEIALMQEWLKKNGR